MNFILNFITNQISDRVTSWQTTIPAFLLTGVTQLLVNSGLFDPTQVNSMAGQIAQWVIYGLSLVLLAWKNRKTPPVDNTPTPPPSGETK